MGKVLSFSTVDSDFVVFEKVATFKGQAILLAPHWPVQTPFPLLLPQSKSTFPRPTPNPEGEVSDLLFLVFRNLHLHAGVFLTRVLRDEFSEVSFDFWLGLSRSLAQRQYESSRSAFMYFLRSKDVHTVNRETFAAFMRFVCGEAVSPLPFASYQSTVAKPFFLGEGFLSLLSSSRELPEPSVFDALLLLRDLGWSLVLSLAFDGGRILYCRGFRFSVF